MANNKSGRGGGGRGMMPARTGARFERLRQQAQDLRARASASRGTAQGRAYSNQLARVNAQQQRIMDRYGR